MSGEQVPWPSPPRDPGPWNGGPPVAPPGNTPLPPLPGAGGVVHNAAHQVNPWAAGGPAGAPTAPPPAVPTAMPRPNVPPAPAAMPMPGYGTPPGYPAAPYGIQPPARSRVVDRAPSWVLVGAAIVVLALIAGGVYVVTHKGNKYPSSWDARVVGLTKWVEKERGLTYKHPVKVNFLSEKEYTARSTSDMGASETPKDALADQVAELRALGFVTGDVDLGAASSALADSGTLAYYDPSLEEVFVRGTSMTAGVRVTLAHELTHVLQDQHFDLERLQSFEDGRGAMLRALAEGDATLVEEMYKRDDTVFSKEDQKEYDAETERDNGKAEEGLKDVPPILQTVFAAPYLLGPTFVRVLVVDAIGTKASPEIPPGPDKYAEIDRVLDDPPSEEVLFDPLTYGGDQAEAKTVGYTAPKGSKVLDEGEFGPTTWYLLLATRLDPQRALTATDGWGGDHYVTFSFASRVCVGATIEGDSTRDAAELADALGSWRDALPDNDVEVSSDAGKVTFRSCDPGKDSKAAGNEATTDLLTLPLLRSQIYADVWATTGQQKESACFASKIVREATIAQLTDDAYFATGPGRDISLRVMASCR